MVAGYRLVRLIGKGTRCQVHLGRPTRPADAQDGPTNVAVKIVPVTERSRGEAEILALQAVTSEHVVALHDVATLADGSLCVVQSLGARGTAAALLGRRGSLTPGETVTLVASMLRGLGDLHEAGIAHGAVDLTHVVIDATGRPLLGGLGSSHVVAGGAGGAGADGLRGADPVEQDLGRVARIVEALRDPGDARGRASFDRWEAWSALLDACVHGESDLGAHDLADRLLDVADATPLADAGGSPSDEHVDRDLSEGTPSLGLASGAVGPRAARTTGTRRRFRLSGRTHQDARRRHRAGRATRADAIDARRTAVGVAVRSELASVSPRVWALGGSALLLLVAGVVAVPLLTSPASGATGTPTSTPAPSGSPSAVLDGPPSPAPADDGDADADADAVTSPDPAIAAPALIRLRASCLRSADATCVSGVDEAGSAVDDADRSTIARGGIDPLDVAALHVADILGPAQRLGDTALIELRPEAGPGTGTPAADAGGRAPERRPASLLIVRGEAGWRIRDLMDDR
ncbi:protein kinase domain-containing protein [Clavibacter sepedonicus]|uniref:Membrane-spanning protein n=1 Tax=Clavibacter sepedonicus TaxID=31964 RepID=B0RC05_CLASE|nr:MULTISPECIES: protein kinase [Clavibacter]UUK66972.1 serine/threonine protein kinase [Clavibacter sepedonicus]CAQ01733.1 putative membrane-spanning protein [Clavibacter sepedonicus]